MISNERRRSSSTVHVMQFPADIVDEHGQALIAPEIHISSKPDQDIAPWDEPEPSPPPNNPNKQRFGFPHSPSLASLGRHRSSESSKTTLDVTENGLLSVNYDSNHSRLPSESTDSLSIRKFKPSMLSSLMKKRSSRARLRSGSDETEHPYLRQAQSIPDTTMQFYSTPSASSSSMLGKAKPRKKKPSSTSLGSFDQPTLPPPREDELQLSTNFDDIDEIVDRSYPVTASTSTATLVQGRRPSRDSIISSTSHITPIQGYGTRAPPLSHSDFHNPFASTNFPRVPLPPPRRNPRRASLEHQRTGSKGALWDAPESWAVEKDEPDPAEGYSSSDDENSGGRLLEFSRPVTHSDGSGTDVGEGIVHPPASLAPPPEMRVRKKSSISLAPGLIKKKPEKRLPTPDSPTASTMSMSKRSMSLKSTSPRGRGNYSIRVYRPNNTYHMVQVGFQVTVADLIPRLNSKLLLGEDRESHRLYLKERGRERVLASTERPADIVRRRLEQAGYDPADGFDILAGEGLLFLLKFVYKSQVLGGGEEDSTLSSYEWVDLAARSLRTIPVTLHQHADQIVGLFLSRNPMLDIPLDFIQSCSALRDLRLSNMAMKKVPHSIHHSRTLRQLDLSSNRIADLEDAVLDEIPGLSSLFVQNNRIEKLPWYFPRLYSLVTLNISNNKFRTFPEVVCGLECLQDLDISFNMITELPESIGKLTNLFRFVMVGNQVKTLPRGCSGLVKLHTFDCRRNNLIELADVYMLPSLKKLSADHNKLQALHMSAGKCLHTLDVSHNEITRISLTQLPGAAMTLSALDLSHAQLGSLDDLVFSQLAGLRTLKLDYNKLQVLPQSLGELVLLEELTCADNNLKTLPESVGQLQKLVSLDAHANSITDLPVTLWNCASLVSINLTSNLLTKFPLPPSSSSVTPPPGIRNGTSSIHTSSTRSNVEFSDRKMSVSSASSISLPPLGWSLANLYLGENQFTDQGILPIAIFRELCVLNLSFNELTEVSSSLCKNLQGLQKLFLSGNQLTSLPEDIHTLPRLTLLFLNGNRLQTLPKELGEIQSLTSLDVGSNLLKYNINNTEFDWNWNFNRSLKYLNLSGNKRLQIKPEALKGSQRQSRDLGAITRQSMAGFANLPRLRVLGLMDVTTGSMNGGDIPDETDDRRVRTSQSTVNGMAYGIADTLGIFDHLNMLDLVHEFPGRKDEAVFAMFGRTEPPKSAPTSSNRLAKYLHENFIPILTTQLSRLSSDQPNDILDALRRSFLIANQDLHDYLFSSRSTTRKMSTRSGGSRDSAVPDLSYQKSGASGVALYIRGKTMYVANAGNALAVVSRAGSAALLSRKHDPYDREETARIRGAEGWISPPGLVNDEIDLSRSFGFFHLMPMVNARPYLQAWRLSEQDEFVIIGNRGLWDYVSYQTAVDIARREGDPMIAAQKLRDLAISYGAEGSTMIMVITVGDLFKPPESRDRQPTIDSIVMPRRIRDEIIDRDIRRLADEVPAPTGHIAMVFTDIRNSTHLWEVNPGMPTAMHLHNRLIRRQLRFCGGYEVKTEGDAFICSFPSTLSAVWFCLTVQLQLLNEQWPLEITESPDGKEIVDSSGRVIAKGLSVRMGIHCGAPLCEPDPITKRMDYFGPMVNRSARVSARAAGGEICCSADVIREINTRILNSDAETELSDQHPMDAIEALKRLGVVIVPVGEVKLKGLEVPEMLSMIYPRGLETRQDIQPDAPEEEISTSRIPFNVAQMRELGVMCLRLEALAMGRVFKTWTERKISLEPVEVAEDSPQSLFLYGDPTVLLPPMTQKSEDQDMMLIIDSLAGRIQNAVSSLREAHMLESSLDSSMVSKAAVMKTLTNLEGLDDHTVQLVLSALSAL